jgi:hypothetical protein
MQPRDVGSRKAKHCAEVAPTGLAGTRPRPGGAQAPTLCGRCTVSTAHNGLAIGYTNVAQDAAGAAAARMLAAMRA